MVTGVAQVQVFGAAEVRRAHRRGPAEAVGARDRHRRGRDRHPGVERQPADGNDVRAAEEFHGPCRRTAAERDGVRAADRRVSQRQSGAARTKSRASTTASSRTRPRAGIRATQHHAGDPEAAGHERRRRGRRSSRADAELPRALPPSISLDVRTDRSVAIRESVHDVKLTLLAHLRPRRGRDLHLPAERDRHAHSQPHAAGLDRRDVRGDVPAQLQPRQPVADGAHALRRVRRRRHHRHAGEHRAAHGDGQVADAGGVRRLEGGRLHDSRDDGLARGGVHPGAVHGRHRGTPAAGIRGHDRRGDSRFRLRVDQPHADAVQPVPEGRRTARSTAGSTT